MKGIESCDIDSVIWEDDEETSNKLNQNIFVNNLDEALFIKKRDQLVTSTIRKFGKNKYFLISLFLFTVVYYIISFECILPMFEADMITYGNSNSYKNSIKTVNSIILPPTHISVAYANRGFNYLIVYHFLIIMFLISFLQVACMDGGGYDKEYVELYSLKKYQEIFTTYYLNVVYSKRNFSVKYNSEKRKSEYPNMDFRSKLLFDKQGKVENNDSDKDSIIVDSDEITTSTPFCHKKFEKFMSKLRKNENFELWWKLNCFNFKNRSLRDNICKFCIVIKPERAFHCKQCRRCLKKMDHHCLFINNCIGFHTYKLFVNMLFYASCVCAFSVIMMIETVKFILNEYSLCFFSVFFMLMILVLSVIGSLIFYFMCYHFSIILKGITQLEDMFRFDNRYDDYYYYLNNMTKWRRFTVVFGNNPFFWFLPISLSSELIHGYSFKARHESELLLHLKK